jgi:hypothetical protein
MRRTSGGCSPSCPCTVPPVAKGGPSAGWAAEEACGWMIELRSSVARSFTGTCQRMPIACLFLRFAYAMPGLVQKLLQERRPVTWLGPPASQTTDPPSHTEVGGQRESGAEWKLVS